jgi:hypothetical protein
MASPGQSLLEITEQMGQLASVENADATPGFKKPADFSENHRTSAGSVGSDFKNHRFFELKFRNFEKNKKKLEKYVKTR